jgi:hypothetical protein
MDEDRHVLLAEGAGFVIVRLTRRVPLWLACSSLLLLFSVKEAVPIVVVDMIITLKGSLLFDCKYSKLANREIVSSPRDIEIGQDRSR